LLKIPALGKTVTACFWGQGKVPENEKKRSWGKEKNLGGRDNRDVRKRREKTARGGIVVSVWAAAGKKS